MATNIGPKIGIDGEAEYRKELNRIIQQARTLSSEMKAVTAAYDDNADSQEQLQARAGVLNRQIATQTQRVGLLEKGLNEARKRFGDSAMQTLKWEQALNEAKAELGGMQSRLNGLDSELDDVSDSLEQGERAALSFGDALGANLISGSIIEGVKSLAGGISALVQETQEYRKIMASLEVSSQRAGYTAEQTAASYRTLYGVLADEQSAATTTANLQALQLEQRQLSEITDAAVGAWATYGDSIPIDGLAESINETIRAGQVTGAFADVLNWGAKESETYGVALKEANEENEDWNKAVEEAASAEDYFNLALEQAGTQAERVNLVMRAMADQGLTDAGRAWRENNKDLVQVNETAADYQETMSRLGKRLSPIANNLQKQWNEVAAAFADMVEDTDLEDINGLLTDVSRVIRRDVLPPVKQFVRYVIDNRGRILEVIGAVGAGFAAWKATTIIAATVSSIKTMVTAAQGANTAMKLLNLTMSANPAGMVALAIGGLVTAIGLLVAASKQEDEEHRRATEAMNARQASMNRLTSAYHDNREAAFGVAAQETARLDNVQRLTGELMTLADETGNVSLADKARAEYILGELNTALGTEYTMTGLQIDRFRELTESVEGLIAIKRAEVLLSAQEEAYTEALTQRGEAQRAFAESYAAYVKQQAKVDSEYADLAKMDINMVRSLAATADNSRAVQYLSEMKRLDNLKAEYGGYASALEQYNADIQAYERASTLVLEGEVEQAAQLLTERNADYQTATENLGKSAEEQKAILKTQYEDQQAAYEAYRQEYLRGAEGFTAEQLSILQKAADDARTEAERAGVNLVEGAEQGMESKKSDLKKTTNSVFGSIMDWVRDLFDIHSPSGVFEEIGRQNTAGLRLGMVRSMQREFPSIQSQMRAGLEGLSGIRAAGLPVNLHAVRQGRDAGSAHSVSYGGFTINVYAAEGMDENALADAVMDRIQTQVEQKEAVFA